MESGEKVTLAWIDGGMVHGPFASQILITSLQSQETNNPIVATTRVSGPFIDQNRDLLVNMWLENPTEWLLLIDSDIVITIDIYNMLCEKADKIKSPVINGIYFIDYTSNANSQYKTYLKPTTSVFSDKPFDLFTNKLEPINSGGLGLTLIHKDVLIKLKNKYKDKPLFDITIENGKLVGEDVSFFRKIKKIGIPIYAHTSAIAVHLKTVGLGHEYHLAAIERKL